MNPTSVNPKSLFFISLVGFLLLQCSADVVAQNESPLIGVKPVAQKTVTTPAVKPKKETRGEVKFTEYELVWPSLETHPRSFLTVSGNNVKWKQEFVDGDEPFFNAIEEEFEAGIYRFKLQYTDNEASNAKRDIKAAFAKRGELLKKRLELLEKGDREGAKVALEQANKIRADYATKSSLSVSQRMSRKKSNLISRTGEFVVKEDGKVAIHSANQAREKSRRQATERESEDSSNREY